tara:strand:- start:629 stop:1192 length:564 start_codon:yes stop_codon:yes gene_type:complete
MANARQEQKARSRQKILAAASKRLRLGGPKNVGIATVTADAGLTHGAFYAHFQNKDELTKAAFNQAINANQTPWFSDADLADTFDERLARLARRYLTVQHRDNPAEGCVIAALASELDQGSSSLQEDYSEAVKLTIQEIAQNEPKQLDRAIEFFATMIGALNLARNTLDKRLSNQILQVTAARYIRD